MGFSIPRGSRTPPPVPGIERIRTASAYRSGNVHRCAYALSSHAFAVVARRSVARNLAEQERPRASLRARDLGIGLSLRRFVLGHIARIANGETRWLQGCVPQRWPSYWKTDSEICFAANTYHGRDESRGICSPHFRFSSIITGTVRIDEPERCLRLQRLRGTVSPTPIHEKR